MVSAAARTTCRCRGRALNTAARLEQLAEPGRGGRRPVRLPAGARGRRSRSAGPAGAARQASGRGRLGGARGDPRRGRVDPAPGLPAGRPHRGARPAGRGLRGHADSRLLGWSPCSARPGWARAAWARSWRRGSATVPQVVRGRCLPYGEGITFWPVVELLRGAADVLPSDGAGGGHGQAGRPAPPRRGERAGAHPAGRRCSVRPTVQPAVQEIFWARPHACWSGWPPSGRWSSCSTTCTAASRRSSTWSST